MTFKASIFGSYMDGDTLHVAVKYTDIENADNNCLVHLQCKQGEDLLPTIISETLRMNKLGAGNIGKLTFGQEYTIDQLKAL